MKGENCTTTFLPLNMKIGGPINVRYAKEKEAIHLIKERLDIFIKR